MLDRPKQEKIDTLIVTFFPELKNTPEFKTLKTQVKQEMETLLDSPRHLELENEQQLKLLITESIAKHTLDRQIHKIINQYTKDLDPKERLELANKLKKEMEALRLRFIRNPKKPELSFMDNPAARETMIGIFLKKLCPQHKLQPGVDPAEESIKKLEQECQKLILTMKNKKPSPKEQEELEKLLLILETLKKKLADKEELNRELAILVNQIAFSECKEFSKLPLDKQTIVVTYGSLGGGLFQLDASNDRPMPVGLITIPNDKVPIAQEAKGIFNLRETPTLKKDD